MDKVIVSTDARKLATVSVGYLMLAAVLIGMGVALDIALGLRVLCVALALPLVGGIVHNMRQTRAAKVLLVADDRGITDYTKDDDVLFMPWERIELVELKASNSNALMLDVVGYKIADEMQNLSQEQREALADAGGKAYVLQELSGLWVSRSRLRRAFADIRRLGAPHNPDIIFKDFEDPLKAHARKKKK
ncbi:hypothetical protein [Olsenella sp. HMSC062G07]|uniref:hypothetical protein n=1 Tax=Olsenella sp. HMSC062G07 TaxID=1739330 RepID=UPI0008A473C7|nr:hypothetical protein [Olsenella sp. HMSC062G07]OFK23701.1 hypothetical protein HMPREF2826_04175 [Olsenella sp. HMSC062G07]